MIFFKTRHEVKQLRGELAELREMLVAHFDIKFNLADFLVWQEEHPDDKNIPVSVGEFLHYYGLLSSRVRSVYYRGVNLKPMSQKALNDKAERERREIR